MIYCLGFPSETSGEKNYGSVSLPTGPIPTVKTYQGLSGVLHAIGFIALSQIEF